MKAVTLAAGKTYRKRFADAPDVTISPAGEQGRVEVPDGYVVARDENDDLAMAAPPAGPAGPTGLMWIVTVDADEEVRA